jgi:hypothetical protein
MPTMFVLALVAIIGSMSGLIIAASIDTYAQPSTNLSMTGNVEPGVEPGPEPGLEPEVQSCNNLTGGSAEPGTEPGVEPGTEYGIEPCK